MALAVYPGRGFSRLFFRRIVRRIFLPACLTALAALACLPAAVGAAVGDAADAAHAADAADASAAAADLEIAAAVIAFADTLLVSTGRAAGPGEPATASLVTRVDLDRESGFRDLGDLLGGIAGLQIARLGGWGASAVPSLRGSAAAQIRFFVDGIPLPDAQTGLAGFGRVPLDRLQAIEVHRGVVPAGLGGVGGAGAVNLITRDRDDGVDAVLETGAFGERGARATLGSAAADGSRAGLVMIHGHRVDNDFKYLDHNQTFHRTDDDTVRTRLNDRVEEYGAWGSGRWRRGALVARGTLGYSRRDGGRPGPLGYLTPHASVRYDRLDGQLRLDWADGLLQADLAAGRGHEYLYDPQGEVGFAPPGTTHAASDDAYARLAWAPTLIPDCLGLNTGLDWRGQWQVEDPSGPAGPDPERSRRAVSGFAAVSIDLFAARLRLVPTWRWQRTRDDFPAVPAFPWLPVADGADNQRDDISPSLGAVWTVRPSRIFVEAHAARTVRVPTWVELFGHRGGIDGNRALRPEEITTADLAISLHGESGYSARVAVFSAVTDDKIIFVQNSQRTSKARNLGRTEAGGIEIEGAVALPAGLDLTGNLTAQRVTDAGDDPAYHGNSLPFLPDVEGHARLGASLGRWRPWVEYSGMSANFRDRANTELDKAPARHLWNLGLARDWSPRWLGAAGVLSLAGEVINLTDNAVYDVEGFPLPGRSWHLAVRLRR